MGRVSIGVSAHLGWAATAVIHLGRGGLRVLRTDRIETAEPGDREASEPFHVAGGFQGLERVPPPSNAEATLRRGLRKQRRQTAQAISRLEKLLASEGHRIAFAGVLVGRGKSASTFEKATGSHIQIHIEEGIAVRESIVRALDKAGTSIHEIDQKDVRSIASSVLGRNTAALLDELNGTQPENGGPWRKEEKTAAMAAWIAWRMK